MKLLYLQQIESAIPKLINTDLPIKFAYRLSLIMDEVENHLSRLQQFRVDFVNKNGTRLEDGRMAIPKDKLQDFDAGMEELFQEDIDIKSVDIPLSTLMETELKLTAIEIEALKKACFVTDDINKNED